jgi:hypothetical protein
MDLQALKDELAKPAYAELLAAGNHSAVAAILNAKTLPGLVPLWEIKKAAIEAGEWFTLVAASQSHEDLESRALAFTAVDYINDQRFTNLNLSLPSTQLMLGGLVQKGVMSSGLSAAITALAANRQSIADTLGGGINEQTIAQALEA